VWLLEPREALTDIADAAGADLVALLSIGAAD
jgi:hypothetical protein